MSQSGNNITYHFEVAFKVGFATIIFDTLNTNIVSIYLRSSAKAHADKYGFVPEVILSS